MTVVSSGFLLLTTGNHVRRSSILGINYMAIKSIITDDGGLKSEAEKLVIGWRQKIYTELLLSIYSRLIIIYCPYG